MSDQDSTDAAAPVDQAATPEPDAPLGEPGQKALREEREARRKAERELKAEREARLALEAAQNATAEERAALERQREIERQALAKANDRILAAEIRAAAKGELVDPDDALTFIDRSSFEVGDDGSVDTDAIRAAVADLISRKSHLAARREPARVEGSADGGTREASRPRQLSRTDLAALSAEQIVEARKAGQLRDLLGVKG